MELPPERPPRRPRYKGKHPRKWADKYKEHRGDTETLAKVAASGKTAAGTHRPIMVEEILSVLAPCAGEVGLDGTLGYGGHAEALLQAVGPEGCLIALDVDPVQLPLTTARLRAQGFTESRLIVRQSNFAGISKVLAETGVAKVDFLLVDLGVSSMQIDNPARGFSYKVNGPLDMRMNPSRGQPVSSWLEKVGASKLETILRDNADEPQAALLAQGLAGKSLDTTKKLAQLVTELVGGTDSEDTLRRVFQAMRIEINDEFSALDHLLRQLPDCLNAGGRAAILSFHSGEDRRVKKSFLAGWQGGVYESVAAEPVRASAEERHANTRSTSAKLRWAFRA